MEQLILDTQEFVEAKEAARKEKNKLIKEVTNYYHISKWSISDYSDYLHTKGNGWEEDNPLKLDSKAINKDKLSPTFIKLLKVVNTLRDVSDLDILEPYLEALKKNGIEIKITPHDPLGDRSFLEDYLTLIEEQQNIISENEDELKLKGEDAEYQQFCTKGKFKELTESFYKIQNDIKADKVVDKLTKDIFHNTMNNNGISLVIGTTEEIEDDEE